MQYSRQATNSTIVKNIQKLQQLWPKLARSHASYNQKVRAVKAKAWPIALHAISAAHLGPDHFDSLRTGVMKSIGAEKSGASPLIHLAMIENPQLDPQFYSLMDTILVNRSMIHPDQASFMFSFLVTDPKQRPPPGPISVLLTRLQLIAWGWKDGTTFVDQKGFFIDLWNAPIQEVKSRLRVAWQSRTQSICAQRKTFQGLQFAHPEFTVCTMARRANLMHKHSFALLSMEHSTHQIS